MTTADLTAAELDHGTPCGTCRWYVIWNLRANAAVTRAKTFAHAHHIITGNARRALVSYLSAAGTYRTHKSTCPLRKIA